MSGNALRVDAGQAGVWALDTAGGLYYRHGTYGDTTSPGTQWNPVSGPAASGTLASVSSGMTVVVVADVAGRMWMRMGVAQDTPAGLVWLRLSGILKQVDIFETDTVLALWGVSLPAQDLYGKILFK